MKCSNRRASLAGLGTVKISGRHINVLSSPGYSWEEDNYLRSRPFVRSSAPKRVWRASQFLRLSGRQPRSQALRVPVRSQQFAG